MHTLAFDEYLSNGCHKVLVHDRVQTRHDTECHVPVSDTLDELCNRGSWQRERVKSIEKATNWTRRRYVQSSLSM
jgi:hypothetical protein